MIYTRLLPLALTTLCLFAQQSLKLSDQQIQQLKAIKAETEKRAAALAPGLAQIVQKAYANMLADHPDDKLRDDLRRQMKEAVSALLDLKADSIHRSVDVLTPDQKAALRQQITAAPGSTPDLGDLIEKMIPK